MEKPENTVSKIGTTSSGLLEIALKPGFYGQMLIPCPDPSVFNYTFATPNIKGAVERPALIATVISQQSNYYPVPANQTADTVKQVFDNNIPIAVPYTQAISTNIVQYTDAALSDASIDQAYSYNNFNGFLSVPIGNASFMSATNVNGQLCFCPNSLYNANGNNNWSYPVFVNPSTVTSATLYFDTPSSNIYGSLVIPIPKSGAAGVLYATIDNLNRIKPPSGSSHLTPEAQVVYVPKRTNYAIYGRRTNVTNLEGFLVVPIGDATFNQSRYDPAEVNINNYTNYSVVDEEGIYYQVGSANQFREYLRQVAGHRKQFFW